MGPILQSSQFVKPLAFIPVFIAVTDYSYFLVVAIMQMVPGWSTTGNYTTIIPLSFFLSLSMAREGYDDWRRHRQDKVENNKDSRVLRSEKGVDGQDEVKWVE